MKLNVSDVGKVREFVEAAHAFCRWVEDSPGAAREEVAAAQRLLCRLYGCALALPQVDHGEAAGELPRSFLKEVTARFERFPLHEYVDFSNPLALSLARGTSRALVSDFVAVYSDLKTNLALYDRGSREQALWDWRFSFHNHWGAHALAALKALHFFRNRNYE